MVTFTVVVLAVLGVVAAVGGAAMMVKTGTGPFAFVNGLNATNAGIKILFEILPALLK